jgi:hypothetical protein
MLWRKWLVRSLVFSVVVSIGSAVVLCQRLTAPESVRQKVVEKLGVHFIGAHVDVGGAQMQLLGAISLQDLRLSRRDDPKHHEVACVPSATMFHDKEKLASGKLAIRKIELNRPRLRVCQLSDGKWNVSGILGIPNPKEPIPTITVSGGTIVFENQASNQTLPGMELTDVQMALINDPIPVLSFEGSGNNALLGHVRFKGRWHRESNDTLLSIDMARIPLCKGLLKQLTPYFPDLDVRNAEVAGSGTLHGELAYRSSASRPWTYNAHLHVQGASIRMPQLPMPLEDCDGDIRCTDGQLSIEGFTSRAGKCLVRLQGLARTLRPDADLSGELQLAHLPINQEVLARLPDCLKEVGPKYSPQGVASLVVRFERRGGSWSRHTAIAIEDMSMCFVKFPYPLEHVKGTIDQTIDPQQHRDVLHVELVGRAREQKVLIKGDVAGEGEKAVVDIAIAAQDIPLDDGLKKALPARQQKLAESFHPTGLGDVEAHIHRGQGDHDFQNSYRIRFHDATARYDEFPYPLENVSGLLEILPGHFEFSDFQGTHKGGRVYTRGRSYRTPGGDRLEVRVSGEDVFIDQELEKALKPELKRAWKLFHAEEQGRMKFVAQVEVLPRQEPDIDVTVTATGCTIRPEFFPYRLQGLTGSARYARHWIYVKDMEAHHGRSNLKLREGKVYIKPEGGLWADFSALQASPLVVDADFVKAVPPIMGKVCQTLAIRDPVQIATQLTVDTTGQDRPPIVFWDGKIGFDDATLRAGVELSHVRGEAACRGRHNGHDLEGVIGNLALREATLFRQPFKDIQGDIEVKKEAPNVMTMKGIHARLFGGEIYGPLRIEFGQDVSFEIDLTGSGIQLEQFGKHNLAAGTQLAGQVMARLHLDGKDDVNSLQGSGTMDVPNGRLYNLPLLLDLLKFLGLHLPDGTAFDEAHAVFAIRGGRAAINRLDLYGNSISLRGQGEMSLDGSYINLEFYAVWARIMQYLPPVIKEIPPLISQNLLRIKMQGSIDHVRLTKEPVPPLLDPLKDVMQRMARRSRGG